MGLNMERPTDRTETETENTASTRKRAARLALRTLEGRELADVLMLAAQDCAEASVECSEGWGTSTAGRPWSKAMAALEDASAKIAKAFD